MTLPELAARLKKATSTVYSWADTGVIVNGQRVRLATTRIGGRRHVSKSAWRAFKAACNPEPVPVPLSSEEVDRRGKAAQARLAALLA